MVSDLFDKGESNPLLRFLPKERDYVDWMDALYYDPRRLWKHRYPQNGLERHAREIMQLFVPSARNATLVAAMDELRVDGYLARDPRLPETRKRLYREVGGSSIDELLKIKFYPGSASGILLTGLTACSKSATINAYRRLMPQVIRHEKNDECGWLEFTQIVFLIVPMPADVSRGALLHNIAAAVDQVLGLSNFYRDRVQKKTTNNDKLLEVMAILDKHLVGVLILEEGQDRGIATPVLGEQFAQFFLALLNGGVPLVLVGNPKAFRNILRWSQDMRRLTYAGHFEFFPLSSASDPEYRDDVLPGIWNWTVLPGKDEVSDEIPDIVFQLTGGFHEFIATLRLEALVIAIREGSNSVQIKHLKAASNSQRMKPKQELISAIVSKDVQKLAEKFVDVPLEELMNFWGERDAQIQPKVRT